jgi:hypothetical protein
METPPLLPLVAKIHGIIVNDENANLHFIKMLQLLTLQKEKEKLNKNGLFSSILTFLKN